MCTGISLEQWKAAVGVMAARAKMRQGKKPTQSATHHKSSHRMRNITSRIRGEADRRRSTQYKATRKIHLRNPSLSKATESNAIRNDGMKKHNVKSDQSKVIKGKEGVCFFL